MLYAFIITERKAARAERSSIKFDLAKLLPLEVWNNHGLCLCLKENDSKVHRGNIPDRKKKST